MPHQHVPQSHIAGDPKPHKECVNKHCSTRIHLQPMFKEPGQEHVRYFDENMREICHHCVAKSFGVEHVSDIAVNHPAVK